MIRSIVYIILLMVAVQTAAQTDICDSISNDNGNKSPYQHLPTTYVAPDSADVSLHKKKYFFRAGAETIGTNLGLWAFDRYIQKGHFAYISWSTIKENFRHGFEWDDDHLSTNMFAHPYNGSVFFNAGRSNGYNFWQSELFAIGGSAMWEMCMEREYPSTNDIIATPIGVAAIGEVLYRTSDLILDDRSFGSERFGRELAAFLVDPMKGFTRIFSGAAWKHRATSGRRYGVPPISVELSFGSRFLSLFSKDHGNKGGIVAEINIEYGNRFEESTQQPYDYFSFLLELQAIKTQPLLSRAEIIGRLLSKELVRRNNLSFNVGVYQHFDYFDSDTIHSRQTKFYFPCAVPYKLGVPASLGGGAMIRFKGCSTSRLDAYMHVNGIILGGILTDFYRDYNRNYNWGSGFAIKAGLIWATQNDRWSVKMASQYYRLYTWIGYDDTLDWSLTPEGAPVNVQGDTSNSYFNHFELSINYKIFKRFYFTAGVDIYHRHTLYDRTVKGPNWISYQQIIDSNQIGCHVIFTIKL